MTRGNAFAIAAAASLSVAPGYPGAVSKPLSCEKLADVPGKSLATVVVDFAPGSRSAPHHHPGSVMAYVLKGTVRSQVDSGPVTNYTAGQTWFEHPGALHAVAENPSKTEPAQLLAIFILDDCAAPLVIPEKGGH
jgi:quercetin dioxygenase-like cupin family protein